MARNVRVTEVRRPSVNRSTIWNSVGGGFSNPGESRICRVGKYNVLVTRADRLDRNGNVVHTATVINKDGTLGSTYKSNGAADYIVSCALKKSGIDTRYGNSRSTKGKVKSHKNNRSK